MCIPHLVSMKLYLYFLNSGLFIQTIWVFLFGRIIYSPSFIYLIIYTSMCMIPWLSIIYIYINPNTTSLSCLHHYQICHWELFQLTPMSVLLSHTRIIVEYFKAHFFVCLFVCLFLLHRTQGTPFITNTYSPVILPRSPYFLCCRMTWENTI